MSCSDVCLDMSYDGSYSEFHWSRTRRARIAHVCSECGSWIGTGQEYEYVTAKCEGEIYSHKTCGDCLAIRESLVCGVFIYGQLWESIEEEIFPTWERSGPWDCLAKVESVEARKKLSAAYERWRGARAA